MFGTLMIVVFSYRHVLDAIDIHVYDVRGIPRSLNTNKTSTDTIRLASNNLTH